MRSGDTNTEWFSSFTVGAVICLAYVLLYQVNLKLMGNEAFGGVASLIFLPAFIRLLGFLIIGPWTIIPLFLAAYVCVDLGLDWQDQALVSLALASGSPLALIFACKALRISPALDNLNGKRLLALSSVSAIASAAFYHFALKVIDVSPTSNLVLAATIAGDVLGTWLIFYFISAIMAFVGKLIK